MICDMSVAYGPLPQINTTQKGGSMLSLPLLRPKILPFEECWGGGKIPSCLSCSSKNTVWDSTRIIVFSL